MAKIIFNTISGVPNSKKLPCFYEGLTKALAREGNDVLIIINNELITNHWSNNISSRHLNKEKLNKEIIDFNPDLVISANNSLYENIPTLVSCPILIYATDSPSGFSDQEALKKNISRYHIALPSESMVASAREYFGYNMIGLYIIPFATDFVAENIPKTKNISFIGTNFGFVADEFKKIFLNNFSESDRLDFIRFMRVFQGDVLKKPSCYLKELEIDQNLLGKVSHIKLLNLISSNFRLQTLGSVADLGLALYGSKNWRDVCEYSLDLALSYIDEEVSSVQENQAVYNSSKISINISHAQAGETFSWRVRDIMACNSVLVSDFRKEITTCFGNKVKIPIYENPFEARQICQKLLQDKIWREDIIAESNFAIESGHRFKHRIKDIQEIIGIDLLNNRNGKITFLNPSEFLAKKWNVENKIKGSWVKKARSSATSKELFLKKNGIFRMANRYRNRVIGRCKRSILRIANKI